jgi:protein-S-isoprenylcysteine O-methyltransferase Ste14
MLGFIYSLVVYAGFLVIFNYFALFSAGVFVPKGVDTGVATDTSLALLINLSLLLLFGLQHSIMARAGFKRALTRFIPERVERATFVLASSLALGLLMWQWQPLPTLLWQVDNPIVASCLWAIQALGWLGVPLSSFMIDHFDLFGVKQAFHGFRRTSFERKGFVTPLLYRYVRHPMMTSLLVGLWLTPHMTVGHLLLSLGMSLYIVVGVHFEERALARELGLAYVRYQQATPKFLPLAAAKPATGEARVSSSESQGAA